MPVTKGYVRLSEAAKMAGVNRTTAWRQFRHLAKPQRGRRNLLVPVSAVYRYLAERSVGDLPMVPEIQEIREELEALGNALERACRGLAKVAKKVGVTV